VHEHISVLRLRAIHPAAGVYRDGAPLAVLEGNVGRELAPGFFSVPRRRCQRSSFVRHNQSRLAAV
jgi:hypothetical protein